jgi:hypothetical protein
MEYFMMLAATSEAVATDDLQDADRAAKAAAALIEKLTLAGHTVHVNRFGSFMVSRWSMSRHCLDLESLQAFADQVGVL